MPDTGVVAAFLLGNSSLEHSLRQRSARLQPAHFSRAGSLRVLEKSDGHRAMEMVVRVCFHRVLSHLLLSGRGIRSDRCSISLRWGFSRRGRSARRRAWAQAGRWFCVNVLAAILTLQLMLPLYPQGKLYFDFVSSQGFVSGWQWVRNTVCFMIGGAPWTKSGEPWEGYPEWLARYIENPVLFVTAASFAIALVALGACRLLRRGWASATFVIVMSICPPITFVVAYLRKFLLYENYVIYSLPGVVICAAAGLIALGILAREALGQALTCVDGGSMLSSWAISPIQTRSGSGSLTIRSSKSVSLSSIVAARSIRRAPQQKGVRTASFCIPPYLYDAYMERLDTTGAFIAALQRSDEEQVPLFLNIGMPWAAREYSPQMWKLFNNPELFEKPVRLRGFEPSLDRLVAKYKPRSAGKFDFSSYKSEER